MVKNCENTDHEWYVFEKTPGDRCLMLECSRCSAYGIVTDPTKQEWIEADNSSLNPYLWKHNKRVIRWPPITY